MGYFSDLLGTVLTSFKIGRATLSASSLTANRSLSLPDVGGVLVVNSNGVIDRTVGIVIDGGGSVITTGTKGYLVVGFSGTITGWDIVADQSGTIVIDVWKTTAGSVPTVANKISSSAGPNLSAAQVGSAASVPTWTSTSVVKGETFGFSVASVATLTRVVATLRIVSS